MTRVLGTGGGRWLSGEGVQNAKSGLIERFRDREQDLLNLEGDGVLFNKQDLRRRHWCQRRRWWRIRFEAINFRFVYIFQSVNFHFVDFFQYMFWIYIFQILKSCSVITEDLYVECENMLVMICFCLIIDSKRIRLDQKIDRQPTCTAIYHSFKTRLGGGTGSIGQWSNH